MEDTLFLSIIILIFHIKKQYIAHYRSSDEKTQSVKEHLEGVADICKDLTGKLGLSDVGELLGLLHDFGKYSDLFLSYYIQEPNSM